jgi:N-acetylmuramoyl-L-alanine amidase
MLFHFRLFLFLSMMMSLPAQALTVTKVAYEQQGASEFLVIETNAPMAESKLFALENPDRIVLDIQKISNATLPLPALPQGAIAGSLRFGHFSPVTSRFVLELRGDIRKKTLHTFGKKLVVELSKDGEFRALAGTSTEDVRAVAAPAQEKKPFFASAAEHKPLIVIDAGHGGKDPGASGHGNTLEKHVTLAYARALQQALLRTGDYNVAMTRSADDYVYLHDRVRMAREADGDMFISLHADSALEEYAKGLSVYTVSEKSSDAEAAKLARTENASDEIGGIKFAEDNPEIADILIDLASRDTRIKSTQFAEIIAGEAKKSGIHLLKNPNRFAGFRVLKAPDIPSVLVEIGFLSNQEDEALLQQKLHREKVVAMLVRAVDRFVATQVKK